MNYGVPYKGSKNSLAKEIIDQLPAAENFYDLFAGGCAVTHAAMLSGKYKNIYANDMDGRGVRLFKDAIDGKYKDEKRWISREDFIRLKDEDPYVAICWSFGSNMQAYIYGREIEAYKKALFEVITGETVRDRRIAWRHNMKAIVETAASLEGKKSLQSLQSLERLQNLERLESLESLEGLNISTLDYRDIEIKPCSVIYCDIPYKGTEGYPGQRFDYEAFYEWCRKQTAPVYVSEYGMPEDFKEVWQKERRGHLSVTNNAHWVTEKLFLAA